MDWLSSVGGTSRRARWTEAIGGHRERLLSFGSATELIEPPDALGADWHSFIEKLNDPTILLQCLKLAHGSSIGLVRDELPALYRSLRRTTSARPVLSRVGLTGSPLWQQTVRARAANGGDKSIFVVGSTAKSSDVPENRGLVACLAYLESLLERLSKFAGSEQRLPKGLQIIARETRLGLRLPALRDLPIEPLLPARSRQAMARSKFATFSSISDLSLQLRDVEDLPRGDLIASLGAAGWLAPLSDDDLFELYVLLRVVDVVTEAFGQPDKLSPIRMGEVIAEWELPQAVRLSVSFDSVPAGLRTNSRYLSTSETYTNIFNARARRPDIIIQTSIGEARSYTLIEVKNPSESSDRYRRDSLYKCFGYLYDFAEVLDSPPEPDVCFLVLPEKVAASGTGPGQVTVVSGDDGDALKERLTLRISRTIAQLAS